MSSDLIFRVEPFIRIEYPEYFNNCCDFLHPDFKRLRIKQWSDLKKVFSQETPSIPGESQQRSLGKITNLWTGE